MLNEKRQIALVTGASSGLGRVTAKQLAGKGVTVVCLGRNQTALDAVAAEIRSETGAVDLADTLNANIASPRQCCEAIEAIAHRHKRLDILINNAGVAAFERLERLPTDDVDRMIDVNLRGAIYLTQAAVRFWQSSTIDQRRGDQKILFVLSTAAHSSRVNESVYSATKWGLHGFAECLKNELKEDAIKVMTVSPGGMNTAFWHADSANRMQYMQPEHVAEYIMGMLFAPSSMVIDHSVIRRTT
jgi:NADP-dependent 3-hydroxy acid dehydrogenase YdfG